MIESGGMKKPENETPILLEQPRFHGSLLALVGKTIEDAEAECPGAERINPGGEAQRLIWKETAKEAGGAEFPLYLMARAFRGKIWAVGLWSPDDFYLLERNPDGAAYFAGVPKGGRKRYGEVNWVGMKDGKLANLGVSP